MAFSWGGLDDWTRIVALALTVFIAAALMSWTTPLAEVAPALARLGTPLRWLRLPIDEWAATVALSIRCLPLLIEEVRTLAAAPPATADDSPRQGVPAHLGGARVPGSVVHDAGGLVAPGDGAGRRYGGARRFRDRLRHARLVPDGVTPWHS